MSELRTIRLYGELGTKFGRVHQFAVKNTAEAVQALCSQIPGFEHELNTSKERGKGYACFIGKRNIGEKELEIPTGHEDIRIAPVTLGAKKAGFFQILMGAILVVAGLLVGYFFGWTGIGWAVGKYMIGMGVSMIVGGVVQMLMPAPKSPDGRDRPDANASYVFNGPVNTHAQGNPVPLLYGRMTVGSAVISAGISVKETMGGIRTGGGGGSGSGPRNGGVYHTMFYVVENA